MNFFGGSGCFSFSGERCEVARCGEKGDVAKVFSGFGFFSFIFLLVGFSVLSVEGLGWAGLAIFFAYVSCHVISHGDDRNKINTILPLE